jgi:asparaginyl-tRNA synthetase
VHTPIITGSDCEGAGETFKLSPVAHRAGSSLPPEEFFDRTAYLTVSSQLHLEAFAHAIPRVYTISPCFRAERSQTNRHLSEFWMLEAEWGFIDKVGDVCDIVEDTVKHVLNHPELVKDLDALWSNGNVGRKQGVLEAKGTAPWARISYTEAVEELEKAKSKFEFEPVWGKPLQSEHERWLADQVVKGPVFVTDYPSGLKPFYMRTNGDGKTVACFDLLMPHLGELVGGSLREERVDVLDEAIEHHGLDKRDYDWYRELRVYGGAPHGGFGLGFERLIGWMTGVENVRECIPIPRWAGRLLL